MAINPGPPPPVAQQAEFDRWVRLLAAALGASNPNSSIITDAVVVHEGKADPHPQYAPKIYNMTAGAALSGHRMVYKDGSGKAQYATNTSQTQTLAIVGMTLGAAVLDAPIQVQRTGEIVEPSWSWTVNAPIFLSTDGLLTQTAPTSGFSRIIGFATSATSILLSLQETISLA